MYCNGHLFYFVTWSLKYNVIAADYKTTIERPKRGHKADADLLQPAPFIIS
jgi:hypothetical protein